MYLVVAAVTAQPLINFIQTNNQKYLIGMKQIIANVRIIIDAIYRIFGHVHYIFDAFMWWQNWSNKAQSMPSQLKANIFIIIQIFCDRIAGFVLEQIGNACNKPSMLASAPP